MRKASRKAMRSARGQGSGIGDQGNVRRGTKGWGLEARGDRGSSKQLFLTPHASRLTPFFVLGSWFLVLALSGCFLISGPVESADGTADGGNVFVGFVSAEGSQTRTVQTNFPSQTLEVIVTAQNRTGQMRVEILDPQNSLVFGVESQARDQTGIGRVQTDATGAFRYRITATGAKNGTFQILYQPVNG
jgi:hypothetical protein